jgi:hypothetical protein
MTVIPDIAPTGDAEVDAARQSAIDKLGRLLTCEEALAIAQGLPFEGVEATPAPAFVADPPGYVPEHPETVFGRAAALAESDA